MSFINMPMPAAPSDHPNITSGTRFISGEGRRDAKIAIIGEAPGAYEDKMGKPFCGPAGSILEQCLHAAQLIRSACYVTNVVKCRPSRNSNNIGAFYNGRKNQFTEAGHQWVSYLKEELSNVSANVLVPMGATATAALCGFGAVTKRRGYITESTLLPGRKVIPTLHPSYALQGNYLARYFIARDLKKARRQSEFPDIRVPKRTLILPDTFANAVQILNNLRGKSPLSVDIEVTNFEVSCIGFCHDPSRGISIPTYRMWTDEEEAELWRLMAELLEDPTTTKIFQNGIFDMTFLLQRQRILVQGQVFDTMIEHSIMYPEFPKGLEFLAGAYTDQPYWKDMIKWTGEKKDA